MVILLDEAIDRVARAGRPYGLRVGGRPRRRQGEDVDRIAAEIAPLRLPLELESFWRGHDPSALRSPAFEGFVPVARVRAERRLDTPPGPAILLPLAYLPSGRLSIELASGDHPGGRVFRVLDHEPVAQLIAFGVSDLLDLLGEALARDAIDDRTGGLDQAAFAAMVDSRLAVGCVPRSLREVAVFDRSLQPEHWRRAEGIADDHFVLRGPTHTVASVAASRRGGQAVVATLLGVYRNTVGGGALGGSVGVFTDATGSLDVFVPESVALRSASGPSGRVEIDVVAAGRGHRPPGLTVHGELQLEAWLGASEPSDALLRRIDEESGTLDTSTVVTAMRPVRPDQTLAP